MARTATPRQLYALNRAGMLRLVDVDSKDETYRISQDEADLAIKASMEADGMQAASRDEYEYAVRTSGETWQAYRERVGTGALKQRAQPRSRVLADIASGRTKEIPARRYDPDRAAALERAEELARRGSAGRRPASTRTQPGPT